MTRPGLQHVGLWITAFLVTFGCVGDDGAPSPRRRETTALRPGWDGLDDVPLSPRNAARLAWTGTELLVFGGGAATESFPTRSLNDGAAYDPSTGRWRAMADGPFNPPLFGAVSVWTGEELIVFGVRCVDRRTDSQESDPLCDPGTMAGGAYDPSADVWRQVDPPPDIVAEPMTYEPGLLHLGWTGSEAVFMMREGRYYALDVASEEWRRLPVPMPPLDDPAVDACVVGEELAAVSFTDLLRGGVGASIEVTLIDPTGGDWRPPVEPTYPPQPPPSVLDTHCAGGHVLLLPPDLGPGHRFDHDLGAWVQVTPPPVALWTDPFSVWTGSEVLFFTIEGDVLAYEPASDVWRSLPSMGLPSGPNIARAMWVGDRAVLVDGDQAGERLMTYVP